MQELDLRAGIRFGSSPPLAGLLSLAMRCSCSRGSSSQIVTLALYNNTMPCFKPFSDPVGAEGRCLAKQRLVKGSMRLTALPACASEASVSGRLPAPAAPAKPILAASSASAASRDCLSTTLKDRHVTPLISPDRH